MKRQTYSSGFLDISAPETGVQIDISSRGDRLWINVDGVCAVRICQIPEDSLHVHDGRLDEVLPES